ncbi:MAG: preprotein translocase subunit SecE [Planctomycetaceae bacterium]|nr:preprotein translocase subunit SecE [Planctomycetaceae bacterium]
MSKENSISSGTSGQFLTNLLRTDLYKRSQGLMTRRVTCIVIWVVFALGAWRLTDFMLEFQPAVRYGVPAALLAAGLWIGYRAVNDPTFADFLIAVEAEMNKVSWPTQSELIRASLVVIILIFGLTMVLFTYDLILSWILNYLGVTVV